MKCPLFRNAIEKASNQTFKNVIRIITFKVHCEKHFIKISEFHFCKRKLLYENWKSIYIPILIQQFLSIIRLTLAGITQVLLSISN